ncbi:RDD family protein [Neobacillus sp. YX16]|uniref:RDD family protein n=1 Tax=Neobacillus sp. YX16 TaxID=3047874 RepID=UPI0024C23F4C|nr:RDD family protein [Neobacillus sp. YX16]WHZ04051.1 RDD family protein [Neobacillus sp. YX16]
MESDNENVWFFIQDSQQQGPVCLFELKKLIEQNVLSGDTFVWNKSMNCWQMAKSVEIFSDSIFESTRIHLLPDKFKTREEYLEATYPFGRPYVRYLARFFDLSLFSIIFIISVSILFPTFIAETSNFNIFIFSLFLWIIFEPAIISIFGNTFGRAFLNTKIKSVNGERLNFITAFKRSFFVNVLGMGLGIPLLNIICFFLSYRDLKGRGMSTWDHKIGTVILYGKVSLARLCIAGSFPIGMLAAGFYI